MIISLPGPNGNTPSVPPLNPENAIMNTNKGGKPALKIMRPILNHFMTAASLALVVFFISGCGSGNKEKSENPGKENRSTRVVPVQVAVTGQKSLTVTKTYSGTLEGEEQASIVAKISERVTNVNVHVGQVIDARQVVLSLDKSGVSSQYYQAEANYKNSEKTLQRMKSLYDEGAVSLQTLDGTQTGFDVAKANFEAARSTVELACPISGIVTAINVNVGDLTMPGAVLATVARIGNMKMIFSINETELASIGIGQRVEVYSEARPDVKHQGKIVQLSKSADVGSRSFEVKALFPNTPDTWFKPGMFCKAVIQLSPRDKALVIPAAAIQSDGVMDQVYLVRDGQSFKKKIELGITDGENTEVLHGLSLGDTVATVGVNNLKDSSYIKVVNQ
jgi:RND family efflux transporter MFP subunit